MSKPKKLKQWQFEALRVLSACCSVKFCESWAKDGLIKYPYCAIREEGGEIYGSRFHYYPGGATFGEVVKFMLEYKKQRQKENKCWCVGMRDKVKCGFQCKKKESKSPFITESNGKIPFCDQPEPKQTDTRKVIDQFQCEEAKVFADWDNPVNTTSHFYGL